MINRRFLNHFTATDVVRDSEINDLNIGQFDDTFNQIISIFPSHSNRKTREFDRDFDWFDRDFDWFDNPYVRPNVYQLSDGFNAKRRDDIELGPCPNFLKQGGA